MIVKRVHDLHHMCSDGIDEINYHVIGFWQSCVLEAVKDFVNV
jgi:hypothetical protein